MSRRQVRCVGRRAAVALLAAASVAADDRGSWRALGRLQPRTAREVGESPWSIGAETLDRDYARYEAYREQLGELGATRVRLQAGWQKCERERGRIDLEWLEAIVEDALARGVRPWLELSYGNTNYAGGGGTGLGAALPNSDEALSAWERWVAATVRRFRGRVREWEVWNEPDLPQSGIGPEEFAEFHARTAAVIRREQPDAQIWALALAGDTRFAERFLRRLAETGRTHLFDAITVHGYPENPDDLRLLHRVRALAARWAPHAAVLQGETGAPSTSNTFGALRGRPWSERTQAKWNLRRLLAHLHEEVPVIHLFTIADLRYPGGWNTKGLLRMSEDGRVVGKKEAWFAAQHLFSVLDGRWARLREFPWQASVTGGLAVSAYRRSDPAADLVAIWRTSAPPVERDDWRRVDLRLPAAQFAEPVWVDFRSGTVCEIPVGAWSREATGWCFRGVPICDSPIALVDRAALVLRPCGEDVAPAASASGEARR
ncbi:MAG: hypothetical protein N2652_12195 [Kiritimatiellae bacterium]|nr:hypothetical protein [Kiritimatiellia bacterium]